MMASQKEKATIRSFVCDQLRVEADLSVLTVAILKKRYLAHVKSDALSTEARLYLKEVVQEELRKMLENDENGSDIENTMPRNKRKREEENEEVVGDESITKKSRLRSNSSEESGKDGSASSDQAEEMDHNKSESEGEEQERKKSRQKPVRKMKRAADSEDSSDEEGVESVKEANERNCNDSPSKTIKNKEDKIKKETGGSDSPSQGKTALQSDAEGDSDSDSSSHKDDDKKGSSTSNESDEEKEKEKAPVVEKNEDSDSSSLPSLDEQERETENAKDEKTKTKQKRGTNTKSEKDENSAIVRLKRYIGLCGVRRNYKKLLGNCKSVRSKIAVLKKELEDLGIKGQPTIEKCKKLKKKRERAQEIAELDVSNIITTQGRPKRRGTSIQLERVEPLTSTHVRCLNSNSESDEENRKRTGHKRTTDWGNLRGVISDDASSD